MSRDQVIFINGVKGSGKDSVASIIHSSTPYRCIMEKAASPLYKAVGEIFSLTPSEWADIYQNAKEEPCVEFWGMSARQAMIWLSEDVMKPRFGDDFFGVSLGKRIFDHHEDGRSTVFTVSDSGFADEVNSCIDFLGNDLYDFHLIRVDRDGTSSEGDSRKVIMPYDVNVDSSHVIKNNGTMLDLERDVFEWMTVMGMK